jgi:hypothetical protein
LSHNFRRFTHKICARKGLKWKSRKPPPGAEELERKARFFAALPQKMRPKYEKANHKINEQLTMSNEKADSRVCKRFYRTLRHGVKADLGMTARSALKPAGGAGWF